MNKVTYIIIAVLVAIIILMRACDDTVISGKDTVYTKTDTIYKEVHDTIVRKVNVTSVKYIPFEKPSYTNIDTCNKRMSELLKEYNKHTTYRDTITLDSLGTITVVDTVFRNALGQRQYIRDYKIPLVTKTITIVKQENPKRQVYIGGNLFGGRRTLQLFSPGLIYKDKKDRVYQANVGINFDGTITYGVGAYWKIKL